MFLFPLARREKQLTKIKDQNHLSFSKFNNSAEIMKEKCLKYFQVIRLSYGQIVLKIHCNERKKSNHHQILSKHTHAHRPILCGSLLSLSRRFSFTPFSANVFFSRPHSILLYVLLFFPCLLWVISRWARRARGEYLSISVSHAYASGSRYMSFPNVVHGCVACSIAVRNTHSARTVQLELGLLYMYLHQFSWFRNTELTSWEYFL